MKQQVQPSPAEEAALRDLCRAGATWAEKERRMGWSRHILYRWQDQLIWPPGETPPMSSLPRLPRDFHEQCEALWRQGLTCTEIAARFGCAISSVAKRLQPRSRGRA